MKPTLGRTVYCIYSDCILIEEVYAIGKDSFIVASFGEETYADSWEWYFNDYEKTWFTSLPNAKKKLLADIHKRYPEREFKVVKNGKYYYEVNEVEKWKRV